MAGCWGRSTRSSLRPRTMTLYPLVRDRDRDLSNSIPIQALSTVQCRNQSRINTVKNEGIKCIKNEKQPPTNEGQTPCSTPMWRPSGLLQTEVTHDHDSWPENSETKECVLRTGIATKPPLGSGRSLEIKFTQIKCEMGRSLHSFRGVRQRIRQRRKVRH